jgi:DnaK suppressor protein
MTDFDPRARLLALKGELEGLSAGAGDARQPVELDQQAQGRVSRQDALQQQAMAVETERRRQNALKRIDAALARVEEGEYGYYVSCGEPIAPKRLELDPAVPTCIGCAA